MATENTQMIIDNVDALQARMKEMRKAQQVFATYTQEQVDKIFFAAAMAANKARIPLAKMAVQETGMGVVEDKVIKNHYASEYIYNAYRDTKTCGVIEEDKAYGIKKIAEPIGLIAAVIPTTNPTSTAIFKTLLCLKTRNAIIISPHPRAKESTIAAAKVVYEAAVAAGAPENIISWIDVPSLELTNEVMRESDTILATGGPGMVKAAYSSGKPALGVGAGNTPVIIDDTADIRLAVNSIIHSKTFDNGTICASEQSVICDEDMVPAVQAEMEKQGAYFLSAEECGRLGKFILRANGTMNPAIVGKSVQAIAELAGLMGIPAGVRVLVARETGVGRGHPYSNEKLAPILAFYVGRDYRDVCKKVCEILHYEGAGHTFSIHTQDKQIEDYFITRVPASRILVNTPSALGGIGGTTALMPSLTLGCGAIGGSATSENVGPMLLLNLRHVAHGLRELEDIRASVPDCSDGVCRTQADVSQIDIDSIVSSILAKLKVL